MLRTGSDDWKLLPKAQRDMKIAWSWLLTDIPWFIPICPSQADRGKEIITAKTKVLEGLIRSSYFSHARTWGHLINCMGALKLLNTVELPNAHQHCSQVLFHIVPAGTSRGISYFYMKTGIVIQSNESQSG